MALSKEELIIRRRFANASEAGIIIGTDDDRKLRLYQEKVGEAEPEDLSRVLPVRIGEATEALNIEFLSYHLGMPITAQQVTVESDEFPWMRATLDGMVGDCVVEAKHVNQYAKPDEILARYTPQVQQQMLLTGSDLAYLSVFFGTLNHEVFEIEADPIFQAQLAEATRQFMECVFNSTPPVDLPTVAVPVEAVRRVSFEGNNAWASHAFTYLSNKGYAKAFDEATKELKAMVEPDIAEAYGHGIVISRSKTGRTTIKAEK